MCGYFTKNKWPSNSLDFNPLNSSVLGLLRKKLKDKIIYKLDFLQRKLLKALDDLDESYLQPTMNYMIPNLKACIKLNGRHFEQVV